MLGVWAWRSAFTACGRPVGRFRGPIPIPFNGGREVINAYPRFTLDRMDLFVCDWFRCSRMPGHFILRPYDDERNDADTDNAER